MRLLSLFFVFCFFPFAASAAVNPDDADKEDVRAQEASKRMGVTPMWSTPAGYISKQAPVLRDRWGVIPTAPETSPKIYGAGTSAQQQPAGEVGANPLQGAMLRASTAKTPDEMLSSAQNILGQLAAYEANKNAAALAKAAAQAGVPQLERQLQAEMAADRNARNYPGYESKATSDIRSQLERAKADSRIIANQLIATDPELARIKAEATFMANKVASNAMKMQQRDARDKANLK